MDGMRHFTLLGGGDQAPARYGDVISGDLGANVPADERATHMWPTASRMGAERKQFVKKFVNEQWILSCKSLGRSLAYHL